MSKSRGVANRWANNWYAVFSSMNCNPVVSKISRRGMISKALASMPWFLGSR